MIVDLKKLVLCYKIPLFLGGPEDSLNMKSILKLKQD